MPKQLRYLNWRLRSRLGLETVARTKQGVFLTAPNDWAIGRELYVDGGYEYEESRSVVALLKREGLIPERPTLWDVGANIGIISIGLLLAGDVDSALAIEPDPRNFGLLMRNVALNKLQERMTCLQLAASSKPGALTLHLSDSNMGDHRVRFGEPRDRKTVEVPAMPLDHLFTRYGKPDLIWLDVQGFEGYALAGAGSLLGLPTCIELSPAQLVEAGTSLDEFAGLIAQHWEKFWVDGAARPTSELRRFMDEIGERGREYQNVVLTA